MAQWNPTIAIKSAQEMLEIDRKENAITVLNDCLSGKKNKNQWQPILEEVISLLLDTCVKSQNYKAVKDGLHQYRTICFPNNSSSLDKVIYQFLQKADALVRDAKESGSSSNDQDDESIESKILRSVSGDNYEERNERTHIQPYIKFLWESFRAILDLVRNKPKLEQTYHNTAVQAMRFCVTYDRKQEFKRIGEMLRLHFQQLITHGDTNNAMISIGSIQTSPSSLNWLYGARFEYLNCSVRLELWQEAFRTVEDINEIMMVVKQQPAPQRMANYYEKLAQLFWTSHNYVFHAYAWLRYYLISRDQNKSLSPEDLQRLASVVLVAALSVPVEKSRTEQSRNHQDFFELNLEKEKNTRLSALLGKSSTLRREELLKEIVLHKIPSACVTELRDLYHLAESKFHPLELCHSLSDLFAFVQENNALSRYGVLLKKACFTRQLQQLSRVFQTMKMDRIYQLAPVSCPHQVEKLIVRCTRSGIIAGRIDHRQQTLTFTQDPLESTTIKSHLFTVYEKLHDASRAIQPERMETRRENKKNFFAGVSEASEKEYKNNLSRSDAIEDEREKKETIEKLKERLQELKAQLALADRPSSESESATPQEKEKSKEEKDKEKARNQAEEKKNAFQKKLNRLIVKLDYLERARREEELPLLQQKFEETSEQERLRYEEKTEKYIQQKKDEHQKNLEEKNRMARMKEEAEKLREELLLAKRQAYQAKLAETQSHNKPLLAQIEKEKEKLRQQKIQQEKDRRERKAAEEEQRKREEEDRRKQAEERRKEEERRREEERSASRTNVWRRDAPPERSGSSSFGNRDSGARRDYGGTSDSGKWTSSRRETGDNKWGSSRSRTERESGPSRSREGSSRSESGDNKWGSSRSRTDGEGGPSRNREGSSRSERQPTSDTNKWGSSRTTNRESSSGSRASNQSSRADSASRWRR